MIYTHYKLKFKKMIFYFSQIFADSSAILPPAAASVPIVAFILEASASQVEADALRKKTQGKPCVSESILPPPLIFRLNSHYDAKGYMLFW